MIGQFVMLRGSSFFIPPEINFHAKNTCIDITGYVSFRSQFNSIITLFSNHRFSPSYSTCITDTYMNTKLNYFHCQTSLIFHYFKTKISQLNCRGKDYYDIKNVFIWNVVSLTLKSKKKICAIWWCMFCTS